MAIIVRHKFVSQKADTADPSLIRPSNWNDTHTLTAGARTILGRPDQTEGEVREVTLGSGLQWSGNSIVTTPVDISGKADRGENATGIGFTNSDFNQPAYIRHTNGQIFFIQRNLGFTPARQLGVNLINFYWDGTRPVVSIDSGGYTAQIPHYSDVNEKLNHARFVHAGEVGSSIGGWNNGNPARPIYAFFLAYNSQSQLYPSSSRVCALQVYSISRGWYTVEG